MSIPFEKLKVSELKKLATSYGINKEDIQGHGINGRVLGTDYVRALNEYVAKQSKKSPKKTKKNYESPKKTKSKIEKSDSSEKTTKSVKSKNKTLKPIIDSEETISIEKSKSDSEKTISMDEETIQQQLNQLRKDQAFLRDAFVNCITK